MRTLGVDVGTSSSKGVLVDERGHVLATAVRPHQTSNPRPGWYEHDADDVWWTAVVSLVRELLARDPGPVDALAVSGIGPAVLLTDCEDRPLRPAILYGIDSRAEEQVARQQEHFGSEVLIGAVGNLLSSQAVGPKLAWVEENEPEIWAQAVRLYSCPGWVVHRLTGAYTLDHYSASASDALYELATHGWWEPAWAGLDRLERPRLAWPGDQVGEVTSGAAAQTGLEVGTPVLAGTIDALAEAYSVGSERVGDTMVMYGSTLFMIQTVATPTPAAALWAAVGLTPETFSCAAGMSTSGLLARWVADVTGAAFAELGHEASRLSPGSDGLLMLPYFAGERTPIFDPGARGAWVGLSLRHGRGHLYRSALEAVGFGIRHNLAAMTAAGATPRRLVAVGGGTCDPLWTEIVSSVTGLAQDVPTVTVGASYGDARMAAAAVGVDTGGWNPVVRRVEPDPAAAVVYDLLYQEYLGLYPALAGSMHVLAGLNR